MEAKYTNREMRDYYIVHQQVKGMIAQKSMTNIIHKCPVNISAYYDEHGNLNGLNLGVAQSPLELMLAKGPESVIREAKSKRINFSKTRQGELPFQGIPIENPGTHNIVWRVA